MHIPTCDISKIFHKAEESLIGCRSQNWTLQIHWRIVHRAPPMESEAWLEEVESKLPDKEAKFLGCTASHSDRAGGNRSHPTVSFGRWSLSSTPEIVIIVVVIVAVVFLLLFLLLFLFLWWLWSKFGTLMWEKPARRAESCKLIVFQPAWRGWQPPCFLGFLDPHCFQFTFPSLLELLDF